MSKTVLLEVTVSNDDAKATAIAMFVHSTLLQLDPAADVRITSENKPDTPGTGYLPNTKKGPLDAHDF